MVGGLSNFKFVRTPSMMWHVHLGYFVVGGRGILFLFYLGEDKFGHVHAIRGGRG